MKNITHSISNADLATTRQRLEIEAIARDLRRPVAEVTAVFSDLDAELRRMAIVTDFLSVLVARKVRAHYRATH